MRDENKKSESKEKLNYDDFMIQLLNQLTTNSKQQTKYMQNCMVKILERSHVL